MSEQVKPLTLTEFAYVALLVERRDEAKRAADADYERRMRVVFQQHGIADGTPVSIDGPMGPVPARLTYDAPDIPAPPAEA